MKRAVKRPLQGSQAALLSRKGGMDVEISRDA